MSNKILSSFKWLFKSDDQTEEIQTPQNDNAVFQLTFKNLVIGTLSLEKNIWIMHTSEAATSLSKTHSRLS